MSLLLEAIILTKGFLPQTHRRGRLDRKPAVAEHKLLIKHSLTHTQKQTHTSQPEVRLYTVWQWSSEVKKQLMWRRCRHRSATSLWRNLLQLNQAARLCVCWTDCITSGKKSVCFVKSVTRLVQFEQNVGDAWQTVNLTFKWALMTKRKRLNVLNVNELNEAV